MGAYPGVSAWLGHYGITNSLLLVLTIILISESVGRLTLTVRGRSPPLVFTVTVRVSSKTWSISTTMAGSHSWSRTEGGSSQGRNVRADWWINAAVVPVTWHCTMVQLLSLMQGESTSDSAFAITLSNPWHTCSNVTLRAKAGYMQKNCGKMIIIFTILWFDKDLLWHL